MANKERTDKFVISQAVVRAREPVTRKKNVVVVDDDDVDKNRRTKRPQKIR